MDEAKLYTHELAPLQGDVVPKFYGLWRETNQAGKHISGSVSVMALELLKPLDKEWHELSGVEGQVILTELARAVLTAQRGFDPSLSETGQVWGISLLRQSQAFLCASRRRGIWHPPYRF